MKTIGKILFKILGIAALIYGILFAVFYWDLDGKFLYYIWEPMMIKRFDNMERKDATAMPYSMKENVEANFEA
ncbi:hypothetical protein [Butyrivibrio sp. FCS014]|uniref:hypothetical protein n=1 Tax=Butyrivibrio sp. FCS014 TaxID=1408304 RepID=UPI000467E62E|nr:hypothetical protein [Butyrivibrio sp. FCS014]